MCMRQMKLSLAAAVAMVMGVVLVGHCQSVMTSFTGPTAPGNWELVAYNPSGNYWFDGVESAGTLTIGGAVGVSGESLTTVQMRENAALGQSGYLVFNYRVEQNQATSASLSVYRLYWTGNDWASQGLGTLTGEGRYMTGSVFGPADRVGFVLTSTLNPGKEFGAAYAQITPIPEPEEWGVMACAGLLFYGVYRRSKRETQRAR